MAATHILSQQPELENKVIQHIGLISGMCDESGLVQLIDERVKQPRRMVTVGEAVKAMILSALGFSGRALYLTPRFYRNRAVDVLIGEGVTAAQLNDASLGAALDAIYETCITELFYSGGPIDSKTLWNRNLLCANGEIVSEAVPQRHNALHGDGLERFIRRRISESASTLGG